MFCLFTALSSLGNIFLELGKYAACPGADKYQIHGSNGGIIDPIGTKGPVGTRVFTLSCTYEGKPTKVVDNDSLFLYSLLTTAFLSIGFGFVFWLFFLIRGKMQSKNDDIGKVPNID